MRVSTPALAPGAKATLFHDTDKPVIVALNKGTTPATVNVRGAGLVDQLTGRPFTGIVPARGGVILVAGA